MSGNRQKEMRIEDFYKLSDIYKMNKIREIRLLGGEPSLHQEFVNILKFSIQKFDKIWIFTNMCIPKNVEDYITQTKSKKLNFVINIDTIAFNKSTKLRQQIINRVTAFNHFSNIYLAFTIDDIKKDYVAMYDYFPSEIFPSIHSTFGIAKPIVGEKPFFRPSSTEERLLVGKKVIKTTKELITKHVSSISIDCGLTKDMFSKDDLSFLTKNVSIKGWGCEGFWGGFDIDTDLTISSCFPYSHVWQRKHITTYKNFQDIYKDVSCKTMCFYKTYELIHNEA